MKRTYAVVFERAPSNYAAYAPDVPGCVAAADDWNEIQAMIREAIEVYLEAAADYGEPIPEPRMTVAEAMAHHSEVLAEVIAEGRKDAEADLSTEVTVAMVEISVPPKAVSA